MEWQIVVFVMQILLLAIGYFLFQQARAELAARAAETPVLGEVRALQRTVKQLLSEIETAADQTSARLESRCAEARDLLQALERRLETLRADESGLPTARPRPARSQAVAPEPLIVQGIAVTARNSKVESGNSDALSVRHTRRQVVYELADAGETPAAIAQATGLSEGEVETLLGLRVQRQ
jgi:hypothetical protein